MNILHVCANPKPTEESVSKQLAAAFFAALVEKVTDFEVSNVDLYQEPPPYVSYECFRGFWNPVFIKDYRITPDEEKAIAYAREQGKLFNQADVIVLTTPMWNYSIPSILKAWIDQVIAPEITFKMTPTGPQPMHHVKQIILLVASGGVYKEGDERDCLSSEIKAAFGFLGITEISVAWADGQNTMFYHDSALRKTFAVEAAQELAESVAESVQ